MRTDSSWQADRDFRRALIALWWSRRMRPLACWAVIGLALAGAPSARAGSIPIKTEWLERNGLVSVMDDSSREQGELEQATISFQGADFETCLKQLGQAVRAHPELPPAHALFAELASRNNQVTLVRPALERASAEDPAHPEVFLLFGDLALREGRWTDAAVQFEKATALASAPRWTAPQRAYFDRRCLQGKAAVAEGREDWKAAKAALDDWLKLEPADALARQRLGKALFGLGQYDDAYQELQRATRDDAALEPAPISMVLLYTGAGDFKKAEEWMGYAVKTAPDSLGVRMGRAAWLLDRDRALEAQADAEAAARIDPRSPGPRRLLCLAARARKDVARAEPILEALDRESPGDTWVRNELALVLAEQADDAKRRRALELAESNARRNPNDPDAMATLGTVYYRLHRFDQAEPLLQAVVASGRGSSDTAYVLARVSSDRGHPEAAPALLKAALASPGFFAFRNDARQWLDRLTTTITK
jgi:tetratricopeptide (TPR) repeat protein